MRMETFLEAIAEQLRIAGFDAEAHWYYISFMGCEFRARETGRNILFMGKQLRRDGNLQYNVNRAMVELMRRLPELAAEAERQRERQLKYNQAEELSRRLGMRVTFDGSSFTLVYKTDSIEGIESFAKQMEAAMASEWDALLRESVKSSTVRFTAEGGFCLN